jgi:hypothetical protein
MYNKLSSFDIFTVDPVDLQCEKKKTKTKFGGLLTLLLCVCPTIIFVILFIKNLYKAPIVSEKTIQTRTFVDPIKASVTFDQAFVDTDTVTSFILSNNNYKVQPCANSALIYDYSNFDIPLCSLEPDSKGEPNGYGIVFNSKLEQIKKKYIPFENSDFIINADDKAVYIIQPLSNQFCLIFSSTLSYSCYNFNMKDYQIISNKFIIDDDFYQSINDNIDTIYLFKNHEIIKSVKFTSNENFIYCNEFVLCNNFKAKFENESTIYSVQSMKKNKSSFLSASNSSVYFVESSTTSNDELFINITLTNIFDLKVQNYNFTIKSFGLNQATNIDKVTEYKFYYPYYIVSYTLSEAINNTYFLNSFVVSINILTLESYKTYISRNYSTLLKGYENAHYKPNSHGNVVILVDLLIQGKTKVYLIDAHCNIDTYDKDIIDYPHFIITEVEAVQKLFSGHNEYMFYLSKSSFVVKSANDFSLIPYKIGPIIKCKFYSQDGPECVSEYTNGLTIFDKNQVDFNPETQVIGSLKIENSVFPIYLSDVLFDQTHTNDIVIKSMIIGKVNNEYIIKRQQKTLYNLKIKNEPEKIIDKLATNKLYYEINNYQTGSDSKFNCILPVENLYNYRFRYFTDKSYPKNELDCVFYNQLMIPWLFDDSYYVRYNVDWNSYVFAQSINYNGLLMVTLDTTFLETITTTNQDSIFTILGSVAGFFSTLMTVFVFVKNKKYNHDNKDELQKRLTLNNNTDEINKSKYENFTFVENEIFQNKVNLQLVNMRNDIV